MFMNATLLQRMGMTPLSWVWYLISKVCRLIQIILCKCFFVNLETYQTIEIFNDITVNTLIPCGALQIWLILYGVFDLVLGKVCQIIWMLRYIWARLVYFPFYSLFRQRYLRNYNFRVYWYFWLSVAVMEALLFVFLPFASFLPMFIFLYNYWRFGFRILSFLFAIISISLWFVNKWKKRRTPDLKKKGERFFHLHILTKIVLVSLILALVSYYVFPLFPQVASSDAM